MIVPTYLPFYVMAGSAGIIAAVLFGLRLAMQNAAWPEAERRLVMRRAALVLIGWFGLATGLAVLQFFQGSVDRAPTIQYGILLPILIGAVAIWRSQTVSRLIDAVPQQWLVGVQLYRALGAIFVVLYATGRLPGLFAWPAGLGDIAVGLLGPIVGYAYARDPQANGSTVLLWNLFGLVDLLVAITAGFLTSPSPLQLFAFDNPNELISAFPLVLVPVYLVPLSVVLHLASLAKLRRETARERLVAA